MRIRPLSAAVIALLEQANAPERLIRHLRIVHDVATTITIKLAEQWPQLSFDQEVVLFGAATHDFGKIMYPAELDNPGTEHEKVGAKLLMDYGIASEFARFAYTHGRWHQKQKITLEDLLVALADTVWKGKRNEKLEMSICKYISKTTHQSSWQVFMQLDDLLTNIADSAGERIAWLENHSI